METAGFWVGFLRHTLLSYTLIAKTRASTTEPFFKPCRTSKRHVLIRKKFCDQLADVKRNKFYGCVSAVFLAKIKLLSFFPSLFVRLKYSSSAMAFASALFAVTLRPSSARLGRYIFLVPLSRYVISLRPQ